MANSEPRNVKMSGYLEKKGKMKMMSSWKNHWFVLEGRLLLYYRSKDEYEALSPCKGSINLGPNCTVKPLLGTSCVFQIETRANTIILKAKTRLEQEKWMQAILSALNHTSSTNGMVHFRYSSDELMPRSTTKNKSSTLSRQYTLPDRLKVEKRHTFCRSFETLQSNPEGHSNRNCDYKIKSATDITEISYNELYGVTITTPERKPTNIMIDNNDYYAVSAPTEEERELLRQKYLDDKTEHIYERISGESKLSSTSKEILIDNETYAKTSEIMIPKNKSGVCVDNDIYSTEVAESTDGNHMVDNDQYCTPDIIVRHTDLVSYHEYNIPEKDKHIYSVPNFNNTDHNDNSISQRIDHDVNPYSVCQIYPKRTRDTDDTANEKDEYAIYDNPMDYKMQESNVSKLLRKFKKLSASDTDVDNRRPVTKKSSFLKRWFRRSPPQPSPKEQRKREPEPDVDDVEYAQIDEEAIKKMDMTYCIDKKLLNELQIILQIKRSNLEAYLQDHNQISRKYEDSPKGISNISPQLTDKQYKPQVPRKPPKKKVTLTQIDQQNDKYENLKTIDEILNDLEKMKSNNSLTTRKVQNLIQKFDQTIKQKSRMNLSDSNELLCDVTLRPKDESECDTTHNSNDELNRLLCELAKVTSAPILTPGVTSSLGATSSTRDQFMRLMPISKRRHSEPDYDIPRPHTNLRISKNDENAEDILPATRFFGPAMPNYDRNKSPSPPITSMSPDSLEIDVTTTNTDTSMPSYSSHKYETTDESRKRESQKLIPMEDEIFIDSLEPYREASTIS